MKINKLEELHLYQHGGIGDQIVALPLIEAFKTTGLKIILYTKFTAIAKIFLKDIEIKTREEIPKDCSFWIELIDIVKFNVHNLKEIDHWPDALKAMYFTYHNKLRVWAYYISTHPGSCNEMGKLAVREGLHRTTLAHHLIGVSYKEFEFDIDPIDGKFITLHDGFDSSHSYEISMKSWSMKHFEELVLLLKEKYPEYEIIQVGGAKHRPIPGVHRNLAGKLPFEESVRYLKSAKLHIDGDSGLVHTRHLFKKRSIVLFGPTDIKYFGYPENVNLAPSFCGNCWWLKRNWMQYCVNNYQFEDAAKCMKSITPQDVMSAVRRIL